MPRYIPERERRGTPGAGCSAGMGLARLRRRSFRMAQVDGPIRCPHAMDRPPSLRHAEAPKGGGQEAGAHSAGAMGKPEADPRESLKLMIGRAMADFEAVFGQPAPPISSLQPDVRTAFSRFLDPKDKDHMMLLGAPSAGLMASQSSLFSASLQLARVKLEERRWQEAFGILDGLVSDYLNDSRAAIPHGEGAEAIGLMRAISRAWIVAHASGCAGFELDRFWMFGGGHMDPIAWSGAAVDQARKIGDIRFIPLLRIIGHGHMEGSCARAASRILMMEGLRMASLDPGQLSGGLSQDQLVYRLSFLLDRLGLGALFAAPSKLAGFGSGSGPAPGALPRDGLIGTCLERTFLLAPHHYGTGMDAEGHESARRLALESGLAMAADGQGWHLPAELRLTTKGKALVAALLERVSGAEIRHEADILSPIAGRRDLPS